MPNRLNHITRSLLCLLAAGSGFAHAATITWQGTDGLNWGHAANWSTGSEPTSSDDAVFDDSAIVYDVRLGSANRVAKSLTFDSVSAYKIIDSVGGITLTTGDISVLSGTHAISADLILSSSAAYDLATGSSLSLSGSWTGTTTDTFTLSGAGSLNLDGVNATLGEFTQKGSSFNLGNATSVSTTGTLSLATRLFSASTIDMSGGSSWTHTLTDYTSQAAMNTGSLDWTMSGGATFTFNNIGYPIMDFGGPGSQATMSLTGINTQFDAGSDVDLYFGTGGDLDLTVKDAAQFGTEGNASIYFGAVSGGLVDVQVLNEASFHFTQGQVEFYNSSSIELDRGVLLCDSAGAFSLRDSSTLTAQNQSLVGLSKASFFDTSVITLDGSSLDFDNLTLSNSASMNITDCSLVAIKITQGSSIPLTLSDNTVANIEYLETNGNGRSVVVDGAGTSLTLLESNQSRMARF